MAETKPVQCVIQDPILVRRIDRITKTRKYPRASRTVRELFLERLKQVEDYGDLPLVPDRQVISPSG
jgi:hypothetical protein